MKIDRIELRLIRLPLVHFFETSFGRVYDQEFVLIRVDDGSLFGYGECVADRTPYYSSETTETEWHLLEDYLVPLVLGVEFTDPRDVFPAMKRVRGHNMAKAGLEMACWDLSAKIAGVPLWQLLGGQGTEIASGVSVGIQDSLDQLVKKIETELAAGYRRIKIKIKPGWDIEAVAAVRRHFGSIPLMVDANAAYTLADADHLARLDEFDLMMIEQPLEYDDVRDHAHLQSRLRTPVCLDESIHTVGIAAEAIAAGACKIINIKPGRVVVLRNPFGCMICVLNRVFLFGTVACWKVESAARTIFTWRHYRISNCQEILRPALVILILTLSTHQSP